jgi:hypothetical protein
MGSHIVQEVPCRSPSFVQNKKSQGITVSGMLWLCGSCINSSIRHKMQNVQFFFNAGIMLFAVSGLQRR